MFPCKGHFQGSCKFYKILEKDNTFSRWENVKQDKDNLTLPLQTNQLILLKESSLPDRKEQKNQLA